MPSVILNLQNSDPGASIPIRPDPKIRPVMVQQRFFGIKDLFYFPAAPVEVSFESLAATYEEVKRSGDYPFLSFSALPLAKCSIQFRLFNRAAAGALGSQDCESLMLQLRGMAAFPGPVQFYGVDRLAMQPAAEIDLGLGYKRNYVVWRITDMQMKVLRRDLQNRATQTDVTLSLQEERNPFLPFVTLPRLTFRNTPNRGGGGGGGGDGRTFLEVWNS